MIADRSFEAQKFLMAKFDASMVANIEQGKFSIALQNHPVIDMVAWKIFLSHRQNRKIAISYAFFWRINYRQAYCKDQVLQDASVRIAAEETCFDNT